MIAHIRGTVTDKNGPFVIVDVQGVGYELQVPAGDAETTLIDSEVYFLTYHHVREQSEELFGFLNIASKKLFELLITVQGIGPKAALSILSLGSSEDVRNAIASSDAVYIAKASGVGKKTAERVTVDLSDKVGLATVFSNTSVAQSALPVDDEATQALMALGYSASDAAIALQDIDPNLPTSQRVREALRS